MNKTQIWLLRPLPKFVLWGSECSPQSTEVEDNLWEGFYDMTFQFIICARSEDEARAIAQAHSQDESIHETVWLNKSYTSCAPLSPTKTVGIICKQTING